MFYLLSQKASLKSLASGEKYWPQNEEKFSYLPSFRVYQRPSSFALRNVLAQKHLEPSRQPNFS